MAYVADVIFAPNETDFFWQYHRRLFTIDLQIEHADRASLARLASWLVRRTIHCEEKRREALAELKACGYGEAVLREHWKNQVEVQTRPLKRTFLICFCRWRSNSRVCVGQAKKHGAAAVDQVLAARKASEAAFERVTFLAETLADGSNPPHERIYAELHIDAARKNLKQAKDKVKQLEKTLGIQDSTLVRKLAHSAYYEARMNAKVVKERLVSKLRDRKFELDPIERSFRRTRSGMYGSAGCSRLRSSKLHPQRTSATNTSGKRSSDGSPILTSWSRRTTSSAARSRNSFGTNGRRRVQ